MHRRTFNRNLLLTGLAAPALASGSALPTQAKEESNDKRLGPDPYDRVRLKLLGATALISWFIIMADDGFYGVDLRGAVPQSPAERLDLGGVPLLGQILAPTLPKQFANATTVGSLFLINNMIVLLPVIVLTLLRHHIWITHRDILYRPPARVKKLRLKTQLTPQQVRAARPIGKAVLENDIILGIVPPSALDDMEFS